MNSEDYRPVSPDLSAFKNLPPPPPQRTLSRIPSYSSATGVSLNYPQYQRNSIDGSSFFSPATTQPQSSYFGIQPDSTGYNAQSPASYIHSRSLSYPTPRTPQEPLHSSRIPQSIPRDSVSSQPSYSDPPLTQYQQQQQQPFTPHEMPRPRRRKASDDHDEDDSMNDVSYAPETTKDRGGANKKRKAADADLQPEPAPPQSITEIEVRTKFPVARIKRIMQADEDVGKVAQATPTAVSKALELFMITLVTKGAAEARAKNSKRVTAQHLKAALMADSHFDFLEGICSVVPDVAERKGRAKSEDHDMDSEEGPKKKGKGRTKKEKLVEDDD